MAAPTPGATGASQKATGAITASTASVLAFAYGVSYVMASNSSNAIAYFKINDNAAAPAVSPTNYDFALLGSATGMILSIILDRALLINNISVYSANTVGIGAVGW